LPIALGVALSIDLLERQPDQDDDRRAVYVPVRFSHRNKLTREDSLLAALQGIVLTEALGQSVPLVKVVHGLGFSVTKIKLGGSTGSTRLVREGLFAGSCGWFSELRQHAGQDFQPEVLLVTVAVRD
jgi:hypothetical protein